MKMELPLSPYRHHPGDCGVLTVRAAEVSDGTRDRVTLGNIIIYIYISELGASLFEIAHERTFILGAMALSKKKREERQAN